MGVKAIASDPFDYEKLFMEEKMKKSRALLALLSLYRGMYRNLILSAFFFIIKHSPVWIIPIITADMINIVSEKRGLNGIWIDLAIVSVVILQNIPTQWLHISYMSKSSRQMEAALRSALIRKLQHLSISYHSELRSGKLQSKVLRDVEAIENLSKQMMYALVPAILNVLAAVLMTAASNLTIAGFFILLAPIGVLLVTTFRKSIGHRNREFRKQIEEMSGQVAETVEMIPVTRAYGLDEYEIRKVNSTLRDLQGKGYRLDVTEAFFGASGWVVFTAFQMFCLTFTSIMAYNGSIAVGDVVMYQGFFTSFMMSVNQIINVYPQFARGFESLQSVSEILKSEETEEYQGARKPEKLAGEYRFENVHFHYRDTDKHVLNNFSLSVKPGECIAFVGESGAGKSTVLNMVIGFYRPTLGRIVVDGIPLDELDMRAYRQKLAVVPQNTVLFSGSIRSNITYGLTGVSEEKLRQVVEMANLQDVIAQMPEGLDTMIGEHGSKLSGGQRQRIAIARAMVRDPQVIILDEATSALDNISEYQVQRAMNELIKGKTTFIVAHRLSTIRDADRIVVMKNGRCVEIGTYEELLERKGEFYQLKQLQA